MNYISKQKLDVGYQTQVNILIVDDDSKNLLGMKEILEPLGENIVLAKSGEEALKLVLKNNFALILLDIKMPGMNGFEVASLVRQREKTQKVPIIFVTGFERSEIQLFKGYDLGAVDYLFKPIFPKILLSKVKVFSDLYRKTIELELERERERVAQEEEIEALKRILDQHHVLPSWAPRKVTTTVMGSRPLFERFPEEFKELESAYGDLLDDYLEALGFSQATPREEIERITTLLGQFDAGPRDLIDLHIKVVRKKCESVGSKRAVILATEGRLVALEAMGNLADYYRNRGRSSSSRRRTLTNNYEGDR